jgi:hypothetical protein
VIVSTLQGAPQQEQVRTHWIRVYR